MSRRPYNPWAQDDIIDYVLDSYGGAEDNPRGIPKRVFLWEEKDGEVWIGNTAAFAEHCSELFEFELLPYDYVSVNRILIDVGERLRAKTTRGEAQGSPQLPLQPDKRRAR